MAKTVANEAGEAGESTVYQITIPQQKLFNKSTGEWELKPAYSTPAWVKYGERVRVVEGQTTTNDPLIALEFIESGAEVKPDPRPFLQEQYAKQLEEEARGNPLRAWELAKFVNETNDWRKAYGAPPLSVKAPDAARPMSAILMPNPQG